MSLTSSRDHRGEDVLVSYGCQMYEEGDQESTGISLGEQRLVEPLGLGEPACVSCLANLPGVIAHTTLGLDRSQGGRRLGGTYSLNEGLGLLRGVHGPEGVRRGG